MRRLKNIAPVPLLFLLFFSLPLSGQNLRDFGWAIKLHPEVGQQFYRFYIPVDVYLGAESAMLNDLKLFDHEEKPVSFMIQKQEKTIKKENKTLPFFPIREIKSNQKENLMLQVRQNERGVTVSLNTQNESIQSNPLKSFLCDLSGVKDTIIELTLDWSTAPGYTGNGIFPVKILGGNTLDSLNRNITTASIYRMSHGSDKIENSTVSFSLSGTRYILITFPNTAEGFMLRSITATTTATEYPDQTDWFQQPPEAADDGMVFSINGKMPVEMIRVDEIAENTGFDATVYGKNRNDEQWRRVGSKYLFHLNINNQILKDNTIKFSPSVYDQWKIVITSDTGEEPQKFSFGWKPHLLTYLSRTKSADSLYLAFGNHEASTNGTGLAPLLQQALGVEGNNLRFGKVRVGEVTAFQGKPLERGQKQTGIKIILWISLAAAVLVLTFIARSVFRQNQSGS